MKKRRKRMGLISPIRPIRLIAKRDRASFRAMCFRSAPIKVRAEVGGKNRHQRLFDGCAYNGGIMFPTLTLDNGRSETGPVVIDLDSVIIHSAERPVLDDHDDSTEGLIGRTTHLAVRKSDYTLPVKGVLYAQKQRSQKILAANDGGHQWQLSVGMDSFDVERIAAGRSVRVNNRTFTGPVTIARNAYLTDLSFVAVGGDDTTWAKIAAKRFARSKPRLSAGQISKGLKMTFEEWLKKNFPLFDPTALTDVQKTDFAARFEADTAEPDEEQEDEEEQDEEDEDEEVLSEEEEKAAVKAARAKKAKLNANRKPIGGDGASLDRIVDRATKAAIKASRAEAARCAHIDAMANGNTELAHKAKVEGWPAERFELVQLRAGRSSHSGATTKADDDESLVMEAALLAHGGMNLDRVGKHFSEQVMNRVTAARYRGFSLVECGDRLIRMAGLHYDGARNQTGHMKAVRSANAKLEASGFTSMTLASILENAADKVLLDAYQAVETRWQMFCAIRSLNDFKIHSQYALDPLSVFQKVGSQGDFANLQFGDRKYNLAADSYGVRFKIDFQTWRNDDLGSINNRIGTIGQLGASTIEEVVHVLLMAGINNVLMFHANNKNYDATAASTFGIAGLTFGEKLWGNQVRQNGTPLGISPQALMVGTALKTVAGQVFSSAKLNEVFDSTNNSRKGPVGSDNPFVSKYKPIENPYLNNTLLLDNTGPKANAIAHQDDALWMLMARQGNNAAFHVGFLDGNQSPKVEIIQNQSEMIGFELASSLHFGVGYGDPKLAMAFNPNAA